MRISTLIAAFLLVATAAFGQSQTKPSNGLIFGNGALYTGSAKPSNGQAVCNNNGVLGGCTGSGAPSTTVIVSTGTITLTDCSGIRCFYKLDMRSNSTITLPCSPDGQALVLKAWQNPSFGGGFTPTFAACAGYSLNWANGAPVAAVLTSGKAQMYSLITDTTLQSTPVYNEMRVGPE